MVQAEGTGAERQTRRWRSVGEKRLIVELTLVAGASVALVARAHGVNANQVLPGTGRSASGIARVSRPASTKETCHSCRSSKRL